MCEVLVACIKQRPDKLYASICPTSCFLCGFAFPVVECKAYVLFGHNIERAFVVHCQRLAVGKLHVGLNREPAIAVGRHGNAE